MDNINIIDIEASGLQSESYPIEIGVLVDGKAHTWLIRPQPEWSFWDSDAEDIHGISRKDLIEQGVDAATVANELNAIMDRTNGIAYSDAASWDYGWLRTLYDAVEIPQCFRVHPLSELIPEDKVRDYNVNFERLVHSEEYNHHRAESDVQMIYLAYCETMGVTSLAFSS